MYSYRSTAIQVLRLRIKDKHAKLLSDLAREGNTVFKYCNELSAKVFELERHFLSGFDFWPYLKRVTRGECALNLPCSALRTMLSYKCAHAGVWFEEVDEAFSTQTCSVCHSRTGPTGREGLGMRG
jgi:Putative transposase DNA-binding domain